MDLAISQDQNLVDMLKQARPMGDDDDGAAVILHSLDSIGESLLPIAVKIGIGLVEHQQAWPAEQGAREGDALALAT